MRKRIISLVLLFFWILQSAFSFLYFEIEKSECRSEFEKEIKFLEKEQTEIISFKDGEYINWEMPGKEFRLDNVIYDVISLSRANGLTTIRCVADKKESKLAKIYFDTEHKKNTNSKSFNFQLKFKPIRFLTSECSKVFDSISSVVIYHPLQLTSYLNVYPEIHDPPPDFV